MRAKKSPLPPELLARCRELRGDCSDAEKKLWACLRDRQLFGTKFRRQHPVEKYILDFYCEEAGLAIELDGGQHAEEAQKVYDERRTKVIEMEGVRVIRFWNNDVLTKTEAVLEAIAVALGALTPALSRRERG